MAQAVFVKKRRGVGPGAWHAARALGLSLAGFLYLIGLIAGLSLVAERMGVL